RTVNGTLSNHRRLPDTRSAGTPAGPFTPSGGPAGRRSGYRRVRRKVCHSAAGTARRGPSGSLESRISTRSGRVATSTQLPPWVLERDDLRHLTSTAAPP